MLLKLWIIPILGAYKNEIQATGMPKLCPIYSSGENPKAKHKQDLKVNANSVCAIYKA